MKISILTPVLGAGVLLLAAAPLAAAGEGPSAAVSPHTLLSLSAYGEVQVAPDMATASLGVVTENVSAAEALAQGKAQTAALIGALRKAGVPDKDIRTTGLSLQPQYTYRQNEAPLLRGYQASNQLLVTVDDPARLGGVIDAAVSGGGARVNSVSLGLHDRQKAEDAARIAAVRALEAKAKVYEAATGRRVLRLKSLSEASSAPAVFGMDAMAGGYASKPAIAPGELTLRVTVQGEYELE